MKKNACLLLCAALCLGLCACIGNEPATGESDVAEAVRPYKFCVSYPSGGYYSVLDSAFKAYVSNQGDRVIPLECGDSQAMQIELIEDMLTEGIDVMILAPVDTAGVRPALEALRQAEVPVINVGLLVEDTDLVDYVVVSDTAAAGALCAEDLQTRRPGGGHIIVLENTADPLDTAAVSAWEQAVQGDGWDVAGHFESYGNSERAREAVAAYLAENPRSIDVIFAGTDAAACGAILALQDARIREGTVLVYGVGGTPEAKQMISSGWMTATASQSPGAIGTQAAEIAYQLMSGALPQKENPVEATLITPENIAEQSLDTWS